MSYNRFNNPYTTLQLLYDSAIVRYMRKDSAGAANTMFNAARNMIPKNEDGTSKINYSKLEPVAGTIEDAINAKNAGKIRLTLQIIKHLQLQFHYCKLAV